MLSKVSIATDTRVVRCPRPACRPRRIWRLRGLPSDNAQRIYSFHLILEHRQKAQIVQAAHRQTAPHCHNLLELWLTLQMGGRHMAHPRP